MVTAGSAARLHGPGPDGSGGRQSEQHGQASAAPHARQSGGRRKPLSTVRIAMPGSLAGNGDNLYRPSTPPEGWTRTAQWRRLKGRPKRAGSRGRPKRAGPTTPGLRPGQRVAKLGSLSKLLLPGEVSWRRLAPRRSIIHKEVPSSDWTTKMKRLPVGSTVSSSPMSTAFSLVNLDPTSENAVDIGDELTVDRGSPAGSGPSRQDP